MLGTADKIISLQHGNIASTASTPMLPSRGGRGCKPPAPSRSTTALPVSSARKCWHPEESLARTCPASNLAQTSFDTKTQITTRRSSFLMCSPRFFSITVKPSRKGFAERPKKKVETKTWPPETKNPGFFAVLSNFVEQPA